MRRRSLASGCMGLSLLSADVLANNAPLVPSKPVENIASQPVEHFFSHLPPYEYVDENGREHGIAIERLRKLYASLGISPEFQFDSVSRGIERLHQGQYQVSTAVAPGAALREQFWVSQHPLYVMQFGVLRLQTTAKISGVTALRGRGFATLYDTDFAFLGEQTVQNLIKPERYTVKSFADGMRLLRSGRVKYFLTYDFPAQHQQTPDFLFDTLYQPEVYLIVSKRLSDGQHLMQRFDQALVSLKFPE